MTGAGMAPLLSGPDASHITHSDHCGPQWGTGGAGHTSHTSYRNASGRLGHKQHRCPPPCLWYASISLTFDWPWSSLSIRKQSAHLSMVWAGPAGLEKGYIAADRKYQAFNYQQCYHIIATNKSVTTAQPEEVRPAAMSVQRREQITDFVNSRHGRQKNCINYWIVLMSQLSSLLCLVNYGPETTR